MNTSKEEPRIRGIYKWVLILVIFLTVFIAVYWTFHFRWFGMMEVSGFIYLVASFLLPLVFLIFPMRKGEQNIHIYDIIGSILSFALPFYFFLIALKIYNESWVFSSPLHGFILGLILWGLVLEAARRAAGLPLVGAVGLFSVYPLFAGFMPGVLYGHPFSLESTVGIHIYSMSGMFGIPMNVFVNLIIGYMVFGVVMQYTGGGRFFVDLALALLGHVRGGPAKVAVFSSALFGSISGSSIANVLVTGSFTIPAMKKVGYSPHYAAAVETMSSLGGQVTPPVMAAVAFIMADWLGISYLKVVVVAVIPAIIFYVSLLLQVDGYASSHNLRGLPREECPSLWSVLKRGWVYIVAGIVLLFFMFKMLMIAQAPYIATGILLLFSMIRKETRITLETFLETVMKLGNVLALLAAIMLAAGMIISGITFTGIATSFGSEVITVVGGNLGLAVAASAIGCIAMGMVISLLAGYIIAALLLAPALVHLGIPILAVHFFILYYTNLSTATPPVCSTSYVAAGLAGAPPMKTGFTAMRIGAILFIIPVFFILRPELLLIGSPLMIIVAIIAAFIGAAMIASALEGYLLKVGKLSLVGRIMLGLGGLLILFPGYLYAIAGIGLVLGALLSEFAKRRLKKVTAD